MTTDGGRAVATLLALSLVLLAPSACHAPGHGNSIYIDVARVPAALRADYRSFAVNCSKCHGLARSLNAPVTNAEHWDLYVARMIRNAGSAISPAESPGILRFLHWYTDHYDRTGELPGASAERPVALVAEPVATPPTPESDANADALAQPAPPSMPVLKPAVGAPVPTEDPTRGDTDNTAEGEPR